MGLLPITHLANALFPSHPSPTLRKLSTSSQSSCLQGSCPRLSSCSMPDSPLTLCPTSDLASLLLFAPSSPPTRSPQALPPAPQAGSSGWTCHVVCLASELALCLWGMFPCVRCICVTVTKELTERGVYFGIGFRGFRPSQYGKHSGSVSF